MELKFPNHRIFAIDPLRGYIEAASIRTDTSMRCDMERGLLAPLSPNEESALRQVANGISRPQQLRAASVARLKHLALIEERDGRIRLTSLGAQRYATANSMAPPV